MADLRIVDAPVLLQESITDDVKMPTGGLGNFSVRLGDILWYVITKEQLANKNYVDLSSKGVKDSLDEHIADKNNPHNVTKAQVGLGSVDNTADIDKPVSNAVNSAIITATTDMATKTYVNSKDGDLTTLTTTDKTNLVKAINEVVSVKANKDDVASSISNLTNNKADKATTLTGYGITDAYTKSEIDTDYSGVKTLYDKNVAAGAGANGWTDTLIAVSENINQRQINDGLESIAQLASIKNPRNGQRVYVKSYHAGYNRGGGWFTFDSSKVSFTDEFDCTVTNDKGRFINGWVRQVPDNEFTPEMWGAYGEAEKLGRDDWQAIEDMFQSLMPCGTGTNMSWVELGTSWNRGQKRVIRLDSLYKHSKTIFIPPNIKIKQSNWQATHSRKITQGFWYSPAESERSTTCAVSNYVYSKIDPSVSNPVNARWYLNKDIFYVPVAGDENSKYYAFGWNIDLDQLTIITDEDVALGLRWINVITGTTDNLTIGGYTNGVGYQNPRCPRVGFVHFDSYVSKHKNTRIRADVQAVVVAGSSASVTFTNPWFTQTNRAEKSSSYVPLYKTAEHTETGSVAITCIDGEAEFIAPTYENWNIHVLGINSHYMKIHRPHNESLVLKHEFYLINSSLIAELKSSLGHYVNGATFTDFDGTSVTYDKYSAVYVKNCDKYRGVKLTGMVHYGTERLVMGENSAAIIELDYLITSSLTPNWGRLGDISFVRKANWGELGYKTLFINGATGSDDNNGLSRNKPRKTLAGIKKFIDDFGMGEVVQIGELTLTKNEDMPRNRFEYLGDSGSVLNFSEYTLNFGTEFNAVFNPNLTLKQPTGVNPLFRCAEEARGTLTILSNFVAATVLLQTTKNSNVDITVNNSSGTAGAYFWGTGSGNSVGIKSVGSSIYPLVFGEATIKYDSLSVASKTYDPPSIAVGATEITTVTLSGARVGNLVQAAFSQYSADIEISAVVSASNTVTVKFKNTGATPVDLPSGTLTVKIV